MSIRLTESNLRKIIREELTRSLTEGKGSSAPHHVKIPVEVPHLPDDPDIEYANAVQHAMMKAQDVHQASYDVGAASPEIGEPVGGMRSYNVPLQRFSVKRPIDQQT